MNVEEELRKETLKWLERIEALKFDGDRRFVENIRAYISDSHYFLDKGDLVRAFECVVWAWAWLEIGRDFGFLEVKTDEPV
ncbi:DUF357 domain-containing protein [Geoglobus sp.]